MPMGSNESIPRSYAKVIANLEHLDDQERKRKKNVEQKGKIKK